MVPDNIARQGLTSESFIYVPVCSISDRTEMYTA